MARPKLGDSESKRLQMVITEDEVKAIDDWQFANRVPTRSEAIRRLCRMALIQEELRPSTNDSMRGLIDEAILLGDLTLERRPMTAEERVEMQTLASDLFQHIYRLYDKIVEQAVRLDGLSNGDTRLLEALDWEGRAADFLRGKSLIDSISRSPEAMDALSRAVEQRKTEKGGDR